MESGSNEIPNAKGSRIDHRTGKRIFHRDAAFWRAHLAEHARAGGSLREYCIAHGLATSTFRRWAQRLRDARMPAKPDKAKFLRVPIVAAGRDDAVGDAVEVSLGEGVQVKLAGAVAARVIELVLTRLERLIAR